VSPEIETGASIRAADKPLVWVLQGHRAGDNIQLQVLADGLGWPFHIKNLTWQKNRLKRLPLWTPFYGRSASLQHLTPTTRETFCTPWPDVVLSVGWRSVPVARWIKAQCGAKLIHVGRPRAPLNTFDLVLTTPQYGLPPAGNVVQLTGPMTATPAQNDAATLKTWEARLGHLPRPWTAVLVGGDTPVLKFPTSAATHLANKAKAALAANGGSLLVLTSPRTPPAVSETLRSALPPSAFFHPWSKSADNPYSAVLTLADRFIVTNDSISMTHEAALTGRPLDIFPLHVKSGKIDRALFSLHEKLRHSDTAIGRAYLDLIRSGVIYPPKSASDYFKQLANDEKSAPLIPQAPRAVSAVRALFETGDKQASKLS